MGSGTSETEDVITDINVTPLVDICLVLVIIFMAIAPFALQSGIKVLQSHSAVGVGKVATTENVHIQLTRNGAITLNSRPTSLAELFTDLQSALATSRDKVVIITAHNKNKVKEVIEILDISKQAGASKVALMKE